MTWLNQVVQGVLLGGYYAILASGLALLFGVMRIINLAHGDLAVLGAFLVLVLTDHGVNAFVALAVVLPAMAVAGAALQRLILERSLRAGVLVPLLSTFGLAIVIENLLFQKFGADTRSLGPSIGSLAYDSWTITSQILVGKLAVLILLVAVGVLAGLQLFLSRTSLPLRAAPLYNGIPRRHRGNCPWLRSISKRRFGIGLRSSGSGPASAR